MIAQRLDEEAPELLGGEVEIDESYFGGRRKGKRGRGAGGKVPVFGLLKRGGKVGPSDDARRRSARPRRYRSCGGRAGTPLLMPACERRHFSGYG